MKNLRIEDITISSETDAVFVDGFDENGDHEAQVLTNLWVAAARDAELDVREVDWDDQEWDLDHVRHVGLVESGDGKVFALRHDTWFREVFAEPAVPKAGVLDELASEITASVSLDCESNELAVVFTRLEDWLIVEIASINRCCNWGGGDVCWGVWALGRSGGNPFERSSSSPRCTRCGNATVNSLMAYPVVIDLHAPAGWEMRVSEAIEFCVSWRREWASLQHEYASRFLLGKIRNMTHDGEDFATDAESGTEPYSTEDFDWSVWTEGGVLFGWAGWGDASFLDDVTVEV